MGSGAPAEVDIDAVTLDSGIAAESAMTVASVPGVDVRPDNPLTQYAPVGPISPAAPAPSIPVEPEIRSG